MNTNSPQGVARPASRPPDVRRRTLAKGLGAGLGLAALAACRSTGRPPAVDERDLRDGPDGLRIQTLAEGVYLARSLPGAPDADNRGRVGNAGLIVGAQGALVIDTGTSRLHGAALLDAWRTRLPRSDLPLQGLVTHARPEFLFGATALQAGGMSLAMQEATALLVRQRCEGCLRSLQRELGEAVMQGTALPVPQQRFERSHAVEGLGRPVQVLVFPGSSGPGDIAVFDEPSRTMFCGGLADHRRIPDVQDARLPEWLAALAALAAWRPRRVVPGHGPAGGPEVLEGTAQYLRDLDVVVRRLVQQGVSLLDAPDRAEMPAYRAWDGYDLVHRRNVSMLFLRLERELLLKDPS